MEWKPRQDEPVKTADAVLAYASCAILQSRACMSGVQGALMEVI